MISSNPQQSFTEPSCQSNHVTKNHVKPHTIEAAFGREKMNKFNTCVPPQEYAGYSPRTRSKILAHLASTSRPFPLFIRNSDIPLHHQDTSDLCELLYLSGEDRWWEIDLDFMSCEKCINQKLKPALVDKIPFISRITQQIPKYLSDAAFYWNIKTKKLTVCPHDTTLSKLMHEIEPEIRGRLSCLRLTGSFQSPDHVASAIHNILRLFPNLQNAHIRLPPPSTGHIPEPSHIAYHLATLESFLPKGVALKIENLLEYQDFMLKWVQIKRKWYQLIPNEKEVAQLNKIQDTSNAEEKLMGITSECTNWSKMNRVVGYT